MTNEVCRTCGHFRHEHKRYIIKTVSGRTLDMGHDHCERFACSCTEFKS